jgi:hypothetical protein
VYADNTDNTPFTGTFNQPTGVNAGSFSISTATNCGSAGNITCGKLVTNGVLAAGSYNITLTTSQGGSQSVTIRAVSGTTVPCGSSSTVQNTANAAGAGATLLFPACTFNWTNGVSAPSNQTWVGIPGQTIFDAGGSEVGSGNCGNSIMVCGIGAGTTGVTLANLSFQNLGTNFSNPATCVPGGAPGFPDCPHRDYMVQTNNGWTLQNNIFRNSVFQGVTAQFHDGTSVNIINNQVSHMGAFGIGSGDLGAATINVVGNEITDDNYSPIHTGDGSGNKWLGPNFTMNWNYNYVHDTQSDGFWEDSYSGMTVTLRGNTFIRNGSSGIEIEDANGNYEISHNVFIDNGNGSVVSGYPGSPSPYNDVRIHGSPNVNVHDNNFSQESGGSFPGVTSGISDTDCRGSSNAPNNVTLQNNSVTFKSAAVTAGSGYNGGTWGAWYACDPTTTHTGTSSNGNHFHIPGGTISDAHFVWFTSTSWSSPIVSFAQFRSLYGQDSSGTIDTTDATAKGCLHVACAVDPVGAGGTQAMAGGCGPDPAPPAAVMAGYTCETFYDNFTSTSTIDLVNNTMPYDITKKWWSNGHWTRAADCPQSDWCTRNPPQNVTDPNFATIVNGKVNITQNVPIVNAGFPMLGSCAPSSSPPYYIGVPNGPGGFYMEVKYFSGNLNAAIYLWPTEYLTAGPGSPAVAFTELDNPDTNGNWRAAVFWYINENNNPPGASGGPDIAGGVGPPVDTTMNMGALSLPGRDNTGQPFPGSQGAGTPLLNWYTNDVYAASNYGHGGDGALASLNWIEVLSNQHNCVMISAPGNGTSVSIDHVRIWQKPPS